MKQERFWILLSIALSLPACGSGAGSLSTDICHVIRSPEFFAGRALRLDAYVESDGFEWVLIKDDACPKNGLELVFSKSFAKHKEAKRLREIIFYTAHWGTAYKDIRGKFVGVFMWHPKVDDQHLKFQFAVEQITELKFTRLKTKRASAFPELR